MGHRIACFKRNAQPLVFCVSEVKPSWQQMFDRTRPMLPDSSGRARLCETYINNAGIEPPPHTHTLIALIIKRNIASPLSEDCPLALLPTSLASPLYSTVNGSRRGLALPNLKYEVQNQKLNIYRLSEFRPLCAMPCAVLVSAQFSCALYLS